MYSPIQTIINVYKTCKKAVCDCLKRVRRITTCGSKRSKKSRDIINTAATASYDMQQEAGSPEGTALVSSVHGETVPVSADKSSIVSKRRTRRVPRKSVRTVLNTEDILPADECDPATENAAAIMLSSGSNNEEEPCKNQTMVEESKNAGDVVEFRKIIGNVRKQSTSRADKCPDKYRTMSCVKIQQNPSKPKRTSSEWTKISVSSRCEADFENKPAEVSNKSRGNTIITKPLDRKSKSAMGLRRKTTVIPETKSPLAVKVIKNGNPAVVSNSNNEEEPCKRFRGVTDVGERAEDVGDVSGRLGIVRKPSKRFVDPSGDAHCAKEHLRVNKPDSIRSRHTEKSFSVRFGSIVEEECVKINKSTKMQDMAFKTSRAITNEDSTTRTKSNDRRAARKAKRVRFFVNGDRYCKGVVVAVTRERYRSFDSLLADLSNTLSENKHLPNGVRTLFSTDGRKISQLEDLEDGKSYICSGGTSSIKKLDYAAVNNVKTSRLLTKLQPTNNVSSSPNKQSNLNIRPKIIFVVKSGTKPRKIIRILLNKRNSPSFEHVLTLITESIKLPTGAVRKVYKSSGCQIKQLEKFFDSDDLFFAYGSERISHDDLKLDFKEMKIVQSQKRGPRRPANELKNGTHIIDGSGMRVPQLPKTTKSNQNISTPIPSNVLNKYTIGDRLGDGNFAVVYRCFDKRINSEFAMKVIKKIDKPRMSQMIENELSILKTLNHPNIINLISELVTPTDVYIITDLVSGGDLFEAIARNTNFSDRDIRSMTKKLASALAYLHGMDIVHRDVKPENLLVEFDSDGRVLNLKLADFGLSQKVNEPMYMICGTHAYVAPEMLTENGYGVKIDVWAAGVILYILLCGFPPFVSENDDQQALLEDILKGTYGFPEPYWDNVSVEAKDLVSSMLQSNPSLRFSAEDVLDHQWCDDIDL